MTDHPLDRPVWSALTTRQAHLAIVDGPARRFDPAYGPFAASADDSPESWAALVRLNPPQGGLGLVEVELPPPPAGLNVTDAECWQMVAQDIAPAAADDGLQILELGDADAAEMLALAILTKPGPFSTATHRLGQFVGVREGGRLIAMAGERMQPTGFTEVSGVCTLPEHRGRGLAGRLMRVVMGRVAARGETPFLHSYAANTGAIALYESLGFRYRRSLQFRVFGPA
ncbi:GNAT family N-acetyltransferase [Phenylobacterium soli]|uniref:GNAT family N-acetyltransferase n=1 Tax=Phenylobacterium soli TaxID=2170551 RepID=A0A328ALE4_9CAUL|nr:GNAT family N-acetyltransferase [Phenylobacterium soli]RAK55205.1 GNAT family N-acetyltransferase [Phenylobacterium soli]